MTGATPPKPVGSSREATFAAAVWENTIGSAGRTITSPGALVSRTTRGVVITPTARPKPSGGLKFCGEWEAKAYSKDSIVTVSLPTGDVPNTGTYISTAAATALDVPENGTPWAKLPGYGSGYWV